MSAYAAILMGSSTFFFFLSFSVLWCQDPNGARAFGPTGHS